MIDIFDLHSDPSKLLHGDAPHEVSPTHACKHGRKTKEWNEKVLAKDAETAYSYAYHVLGDRFKLGEPAIVKDRNSALAYATYVLKGRFPEAEAKLALDSFFSFYYATEALKGRFIEGEKAISRNDDYARAYNKRYGTNS